MPRKNNEGAPLHQQGKMSEETRKALYGGTGRDQGSGRREDADDVQREYSGASESGSGERAGQVAGTKD